MSSGDDGFEQLVRALRSASREAGGGNVLLYSGAEDEDFDKVVQEFKRVYILKTFGVQHSTGNAFADAVNAELHKCTVFIGLCDERALTVARSLYKQLENECSDLIAGHSPEDEPPRQNQLFNQFLQSMKGSLGPQDLYVHWLKQAELVQLQEVSSAGF